MALPLHTLMTVDTMRGLTTSMIKPIYIVLMPPDFLTKVISESIMEKLQEANPDILITTPHFVFPIDDTIHNIEYAVALLNKADGSIIVATDTDSPLEGLIKIAVESGKPTIYVNYNESELTNG